MSGSPTPTPAERAVLLARCRDDQTAEGAARRLGVSVGTVNALCWRAYRRLNVHGIAGACWWLRGEMLKGETG